MGLCVVALYGLANRRLGVSGAWPAAVVAPIERWRGERWRVEFLAALVAGALIAGLLGSATRLTGYRFCPPRCPPGCYCRCSPTAVWRHRAGDPAAPRLGGTGMAPARNQLAARRARGQRPGRQRQVNHTTGTGEMPPLSQGRREHGVTASARIFAVPEHQEPCLRPGGSAATLRVR